jgi:NADH dehydrogenase
MKTIAITGADGFLGRNLSDFLHDRGYRIIALIRNADDKPNQKYLAFKCNLPDEIDEGFISEKVDCIIHCAFTMKFRDKKSAHEVNIEGTKRIIDIARKSNIKFIFVSSLSAHEDAESFYGRSKFFIESMLNYDRDTVIKPGFIIGNGSIFLRIVNIIKKIPIIPLFYGEKIIQTVSVEDVCKSTLNIIEHNLVGKYHIAERHGVTMLEFYKEIAKKIGKKRIFIPMPSVLFQLVLSITEKLKIPLPVSKENLLGLSALRKFNLEEDIKKIGLEPKTVYESLTSLKILGENEDKL